MNDPSALSSALLAEDAVADSRAGEILYEFPCNEKTRMYLRLEMLFRRYEWFCKQDDPIAHHAALSALFELVDASARSDLRNELLQEIERQRQHLYVLRGNPGVLQTPLEQTLEELARAANSIRKTVGRSAQQIRENEWLQLIRARQSIPGGTTEFDLPMLHYWLSRSAAERRTELEGWVSLMNPTRDGIRLVLGLLRNSMTERLCEAVGGMFQLPMSGRNHALARIWVTATEDLVPEVSANKYMLWVRFSRPDAGHRLHVSRENVSFRLGLC